MEESRQSESDTNVRDDAASPHETPRSDEVRLDEAPPRPPDSTIDSAVLVHALTTLSEYLSNEFDAGAEHGMRSIVYVRGRHKSCPLRHDVSLTVDEIVACIRLWLDGRSSS